MFYRNITIHSRVALVKTNPLTINFATATLANLKYPIQYRQEFLPVYYVWQNVTFADNTTGKALQDTDFGGF
jgi:hypothetical protein